MCENFCTFTLIPNFPTTFYTNVNYDLRDLFNFNGLTDDTTWIIDLKIIDEYGYVIGSERTITMLDGFNFIKTSSTPNIKYELWAYSLYALRSPQFVFEEGLPPPQGITNTQDVTINTSQFTRGSPITLTLVDKNRNFLFSREVTSEKLANQLVKIRIVPNQAYLIVSQGNISNEYSLSPVSNICFIKDTPVQTEQGIFPIQSLTKKHTILGQSIQLTKTVSPEKQLVQIQKGALGKNLPSQTTTLSLQHKLSIHKKMICAKDLVNRTSIRLIPYKGQTLYNVLLDEHATMIVNGLVAETLDPKCLVAELYKGKYVPKNKRIVLPVENKVYGSFKEYEPLHFKLHK